MAADISHDMEVRAALSVVLSVLANGKLKSRQRVGTRRECGAIRRLFTAAASEASMLLTDVPSFCDTGHSARFTKSGAEFTPARLALMARRMLAHLLEITAEGGEFSRLTEDAKANRLFDLTDAQVEEEVKHDPSEFHDNYLSRYGRGSAAKRRQPDLAARKSDRALQPHPSTSSSPLQVSTCAASPSPASTGWLRTARCCCAVSCQSCGSCGSCDVPVQNHDFSSVPQA